MLFRSVSQSRYKGWYRDVRYEFTNASDMNVKMSNQYEEVLYYDTGYYLVQGKGLRGLRGY